MDDKFTLFAVGPVWNVVSCYACGMRGDDALQRDWPPCEDEELKHSKIDACGGGRMRCYVMYGECKLNAVLNVRLCRHSSLHSAHLFTVR
jgi:hypothetical protein